MPNEFAAMVVERLKLGLESSAGDNNQVLNESLRLLSKWRSELIKNTFLKNEGCTVLEGPLRGLEFLDRSAEGCHVAKLLGCYEQPLHAFFENILAGKYRKIINIGCAEGYYAVGFAFAVKGLISLAYDIDPAARRACKALAEQNSVSDRVVIGGEFTASNFQAHAGRDVLVFCDVEGAEVDLLDPILAPSLAEMDLIVESHDCLRADISELLTDRFSATHDVELIADNGLRQLNEPPTWFSKLSHLDQLLATWEWRSGPTPWLILTSKMRAYG